MNRSFSAECDTLGLSHLKSASNAVLSQSLGQHLKDFASHLRKNASPPLPHHRVLNAVSCASGFPSWDAFVRATRRLESQDQAADAERAGLCDALPLLVNKADTLDTAATSVFEAFSKRVEQHTGYDGPAVREALAQLWGARSYHDMLAKPRRAEFVNFVLELDGELVWPAVVGPLRQLLEDAERRAALAATIHAAARRDAAKFADSLRVQLAAIKRAFPEQEQVFVHAKRLRDLPWGSTPPAHRDKRASRLCAAYSYWAFCKDAAGASGTRTWNQFETKYAVSWRYLLEQTPLMTEVPCPACSKSASVSVAFIPGKRQTAEQWELKCSCGHVERQSSMISQVFAGFEPDSTLVNCDCPSCDGRRHRAMADLAPYAKSLGESLLATLRARAREIALGKPDSGALTLGEDGEVFEGEKQVGQYRERVFAGVAPEDGVVARSMRERGGALSHSPVSRYLARTGGYLWSVTEVSAKNLIELAFEWELKPHFPFYDICDDTAKHRIQTKNREHLDSFLGGFVPGGMESFRKWLSTSQKFVGRRWLTIPAVVSIAKSADRLHVSPDIAIPPSPDFP
jgi:hypothetical protein